MSDERWCINCNGPLKTLESHFEPPSDGDDGFFVCLSPFDEAAGHAVMGCLMLREGKVPFDGIAGFADKLNDLIQTMRTYHARALSLSVRQEVP